MDVVTEQSLGPEDRLARHVKENKKPSMNGLADSAMGGVTVSFLSQVFRMDPAAVKRRLTNCPILESRKRGTTQTQHIYDLATAAKYLVETDLDPKILISKLKKEDLPPAISTAYWDALLKKQKFEENAADLWRTERVWEVLSDSFQTMKFSIQLWAETVERETGLTEEQREIIYRMADGLQQDLYDALVRKSEGKVTGSQLDEIPDNMKMGVFDESGLDAEAQELI